MKLPLVAGVAVVAAIGATAAYFALRDTTSSCEKLVGSIAELEQLVGAQLEMRSGYESKSRCYQYVDRRGRAGGGVVNLESSSQDNYDARPIEDPTRYVDQVRFATAAGEATLFVAAASEAQHLVIVRGKGARTIRILLDRELFPVEKAKTYVLAVGQRAQ